MFKDTNIPFLFYFQIKMLSKREYKNCSESRYRACSWDATALLVYFATHSLNYYFIFESESKFDLHAKP